MSKKIKAVKEEVVQVQETVMAKKRVQTAEGWKRGQLMHKQAAMSKPAKTHKAA